MAAATWETRQRRLRVNWYNPFVKLETAQDAKQATTFGGGIVLAFQGLSVLGSVLRLLSSLQHPATNAPYAAFGSMIAIGLTVALLVAIGVDLARRQALWAAIVLAALVGLGVLMQLANNWVHLVGYASLASIGGSILCVRGALAAK